MAPLLWAASYLAARGLTAAFVWLSLWRFRRRADAPWYERARLLHPSRHVVGVTLLGTAVLAGVAAGAVAAPEYHQPGRVWGGLAALAAWLGVAAASKRTETRVLSDEGPGRVGRGVTERGILHLPWHVPFLLTFAFVPSRWGWGAAAVLGLAALAMTLQVTASWVLVWARLGLARPASDRLLAVVGGASARTGVTPRSVFEIDSPHANAVAWPVARRLVYTRPVLEALDDAELTAVTVHELGHLNEPWPVYFTRVGVSFLLIGSLSAIPLAGSFGLWGLTPVALMLAGLVVLQRVARRMEERADSLASRHEGETAGVYARALEKIYRANLIPVVLPGARQVHPHLYDRMVAAGVPPGYERPQPPARSWLAVALYLGLLAASAVLFFGAAGREARRTAGAAADAQSPAYFAEIADLCLREGNLDGAEYFLDMAEGLQHRWKRGDARTVRLLRAVRQRVERQRRVEAEAEAGTGAPRRALP